MTFHYVFEKDDQKKETQTPEEGIPMMTRTMSNLSFAVDDSRVEVLAESLIDTQRSDLDHFRDLTKKQWVMITAKDDKIMKLKQKLADFKQKTA